MKDSCNYVLNGTVAQYLDVSGKHILDRLQPHTDWLNARYEYGLDPYSKIINGPISTTCQVEDRNGKKFHGINMASQDYLSLASHPRIKKRPKPLSTHTVFTQRAPLR